MTKADQPKLRVDAARNPFAASSTLRIQCSAGGGLNVPMEEITAEAGLGIATLHRRFPSKEKLVKAVLDQEFNDVIAPALERVNCRPHRRRSTIFRDTELSPEILTIRRIWINQGPSKAKNPSTLCRQTIGRQAVPPREMSQDDRGLQC
ncbi:TetR/AcrR family transcriptional regulator [Streptomyces sp. NPDC059909]|uniref:TetR/AcrR family transcriptional regulator n=1 Tax=Streptomyces sp. NPDC059909 TaxID=3346998 RepID=UPI0036620390